MAAKAAESTRALSDLSSTHYSLALRWTGGKKSADVVYVASLIRELGSLAPSLTTLTSHLLSRHCTESDFPPLTLCSAAC